MGNLKSRERRETMKKYSWILALILALTMAFVFTACPGDPEDETTNKEDPGTDPTKPNPPAEGSFTVKLGTADVTASVVGGNNGTLTASGNSYTFTYGTVSDSNYGNAIVRFKVPFGTQKLSAYGKVTIKWKGVEGDIESKNLFLLAAATEAELTPWKGDPDIRATVVSSLAYHDIKSSYPRWWDATSGGVAVGGEGAVTDTVDVELPIKKGGALTGDVWFSVFLNADNRKEVDGVKVDPPTKYTISDITFVAGGYVEPDPPQNLIEPEEPWDDTPDTLYVTPDAEDGEFYIDLNNWKKQETANVGLSTPVRGSTIAADKITIKFTKDAQRINFKLSDEIIEALEADAPSGDDGKIGVRITIDGEVTEGADTGDSFRYHIGDITSNGGWNATSGSGDGKLAAKLVTFQTYDNLGGKYGGSSTTPTEANPDPTNSPNYLILQHRNANAVTIEIKSIKIEVLSAWDGLEGLGLKTGITVQNKAKFDEETGIIDFTDTTDSKLAILDLAVILGESFAGFTDGTKKIKVDYICKLVAKDTQVTVNGGDWSGPPNIPNEDAIKYPTLKVDKKEILELNEAWFTAGSKKISFQCTHDDAAYYLNIISVRYE